ncbi:branched-chain amino acid ABC transporter permease [Streptomyces sp. NPDC048192]|uniref:branched-chain amino acid ABC transporter permease n=1 Tax=Streptomyces sp. NPDC048192 TaxID=3365510 RepID=UPI0037122DD6
MEVAQVLFNGVSAGAAIALVAVGLTLVFGILRVVNFAHGVLFMLGAYATYLFTGRLSVPYLVAIVLAALVIAAVAIGLDLLVFKRFHGLSLEGAIAAIALTLLLQNLAFLVFGGASRGVRGPLDDVTVTFAGLTMQGQRLFVIGAAVVLVLALGFLVYRTSFGRAMRAVQQYPSAARLHGIEPNRISTLTFGLGGALAGAAGALVAPEQVLLPSMGEAPLLLGFVAIILGGMGSVGGALVASLVIGIVQSGVSTYWTPQASVWMSFALVLVVLTLRPKGLFGHE